MLLVMTQTISTGRARTSRSLSCSLTLSRVLPLVLYLFVAFLSHSSRAHLEMQTCMASGALSAWIFLTHLSSLFLPVVKRQQREKGSEIERQSAREVFSTIVLNAIEPFKTSDMQARNK